ncbi:MAG: TonB-dependent receptor [Candidatus Azobacteroides sp.]|nr:TonB-dependent receptor [Candidatus Azobacteroides sp.]
MKKIKFFILFLWIPFCLSAQDLSVSGTVKDKNGDALIGVSIVEKGTTNGTVTDIDGEYSLKVSSNATLEFSYIGFTTQSIPVQGRSRLIVVMEEDTKALSEVVVIGYGTQRREAVTGSVASIQGNVLRDIPAGNVTNALQGRLPGVVMTQTNSQPGQNMQIRIRGTRSLNATNDPLVVLDGIPFAGNIGDINPSDIKAIDILKDASATAIYGSRGANGVIMVTTYKGNLGQQARVSYDGYYGVVTLFHRYPMMTGDQLYRLRGVAAKYTMTDENGNLVPALGRDEQLGQNSDWQDFLYKKEGMTTNHHINVTGGTDKASYNFGAGYFKQTSLLPEQDYSRFNLNSSLDQQIGQYIKVGFTTNTNYALTNGQNLSLVQDLLLSPLINPYNEDGSWKNLGSDPINANQWLYSRKTSESFGDRYADNQKTFGTYNSIYGEVKIPGVEGLSYRINIGLNYWTLNRGQYRGVGVFASGLSTASVQQQNNTNWAVENILTYDKYFDKHHINLTGLYSGEQTQSTQTYVSATNVLADFFQYYNLGQVENSGTDIVVNPSNSNGQGQYLNKFGLISWMGRAMYDYDSRYMLSVAMRGDGSSRLAPGHQWHVYPAISAGWNISREAFMDDVQGVNNLKLRLGWGQTSNQAIDPYQTLGQLSSQPYNFGATTATGYYVSLAPNPDLGWEYSKTWNFGIDFGFLKNRLTGSIDYYAVKTTDLLYKISLPRTSGVDQQTANVGSSQNKGLEIALNGTIFDNPDGWSWDIGVNFAANKNKITSIGGGRLYDITNFFFVGQPINVIYDYKKIGIWQQNDPYLNILEPGGNPGMIKVLYTGDYNPNGTPVRQIGTSGVYGNGTDDRQVMGVDPSWQGGFNTRVAYKNVDLTVLGTFQHGGLLISSLYNSAGYLNNLTGQRGNVDVDYWTPTHTSGTYPLPGGAPTGDGPKYGSTLGYFDASYLKVSNITLGYNFNQTQWMKYLGVDRARVYFTVQNAFVLFSPYNNQSGQDPVTNSTNANTNGSNPFVATTNTTNIGRTVLPMVGANTPSTRTYLLGLNVSF